MNEQCERSFPRLASSSDQSQRNSLAAPSDHLSS
jgi:hypothetical protein